MDEPSRTPSQSQALARLRFDEAKREADGWAHVIAQDVLAANESGDWSRLPTRGMLASFKAAKAALAHASDVLFAQDREVAS